MMSIIAPLSVVLSYMWYPEFMGLAATLTWVALILPLEPEDRITKISLSCFMITGGVLLGLSDYLFTSVIAILAGVAYASRKDIA